MREKTGCTWAGADFSTGGCQEMLRVGKGRDGKAGLRAAALRAGGG